MRAEWVNFLPINLGKNSPNLNFIMPKTLWRFIQAKSGPKTRNFFPAIKVGVCVTINTLQKDYMYLFSFFFWGEGVIQLIIWLK